MAIGIWRKLPDEIVLNITARLLPRRSLVRLRTVWNAWNEMLSSYAMMQRIYPNIHLSYNSAFLFQFNETLRGNINSWVMEGSGDYYKVGEYPYRIEIAWNTMFCLHHDFNFYICDENTRSLKRIPGPIYQIILDPLSFFGQAFDRSIDQFIMVAGFGTHTIEVYDSSTDAWSERELICRYSGHVSISGPGVYHRGRFYWLDFQHSDGVAVELNLSDSQLTCIRLPDDANYRNLEDPDDRHPHNYYLGGSDVGGLILIEKESGFMWKLESGEDIYEAQRWGRVDISLPREISAISVNNSGWIIVVAEGINVYDGNRRLVRKVATDEVHWEFGIQIEQMKTYRLRDIRLGLPLLPFECTYLWWPGNKDF